MAANVVSTLPLVADTQFEKLALGTPDWTCVHTATASALAATVAGVAGVQHFLEHATLSFSTAPGAVGTLQVKDGSTVLWQVEIAASAGVWDFDFALSPLRSSVGAALTVSTGSPGGAVVGTLSTIGYSSRSLAAFT